MDLNEYQQKAMSTCMPTSSNYVYMAEGLVGEVGEFMSKVVKGIKKGNLMITNNQIFITDTMAEETEKGLIAELGDVLWFVSGIASVLGYSLEDVAKRNINKLAQRKQNGTIDGSGDGVTKEERK